MRLRCCSRGGFNWGFGSVLQSVGQPVMLHAEHSPCSESRCQPYSIFVNTTNWGTFPQFFTHHKDCWVSVTSSEDHLDKAVFLEANSYSLYNYSHMRWTIWLCWRQMKIWNKNDTVININWLHTHWSMLAEVQLINAYIARIFQALCLCTKVNISIIHCYFCDSNKAVSTVLYNPICNHLVNVAVLGCSVM
jgi:hypothetical protein